MQKNYLFRYLLAPCLPQGYFFAVLTSTSSVQAEGALKGARNVSQLPPKPPEGGLIGCDTELSIFLKEIRSPPPGGVLSVSK